ncbi:MAG: ribosome silencing factor [Candidatus Kapaibacterium sp.]
MAKYGKPRSAKGLATFCARVADDKLATNIVLMNLSKIETAPADFFVMCSCDSDTQVRAVADEIIRQAKQTGLDKPNMEGAEAGEWILLDFFDVVVHVMLTGKRKYYNLEKLWGDASFMVLNDNGEPRVLKQDKVFKLISGEEI